MSVALPSDVLVVASKNATVTFFGIPGADYFVQRDTNMFFTNNPGLSNFPSQTAPANGIMQEVDDFSDLGSVPSTAYYRLVSP